MTVPSGSALLYPPNSQPSLKRVMENRAPTSNDYKNFREGDEWLDKSSDDWWKLADITGTVALWVKIGGTAGAVETFIPDAGTSPVVPNASNEVTLSGSTGIITTGSTNTITWSLDGSVVTTQYDADSGSAVPAAGILNILGDTGIVTSATGNTVTIALDGSVVTTQYDGDSGSATPTAGVLNIVGGNGTISSATGNTVTVEMNSPFTGDFTFTASNLSVESTTGGVGNPNIYLSGGVGDDFLECLVKNTNGGTGAHAHFTARAQDGGGDVLYKAIVDSGTGDWIWGVDNSDSDAWKLASANLNFASGVVITIFPADSIVRFVDTGAIMVPVGTTGERPGTPENGMIRYNTTTGKFEGYEAGAWANFV